MQSCKCIISSIQWFPFASTIDLKSIQAIEVLQLQWTYIVYIKTKQDFAIK